MADISTSKNIVEFSDLMNCIVYHANIFNYDKQFLTQLATKNIQFNFEAYNEKNIDKMDDLYDFLTKYEPKDQIEYLTYYLRKKILENLEENEFDPNKEEELKSSVIIVKKAIRGLLKLLKFSLDCAQNEIKNSGRIVTGYQTADNIITCLLFIDGISMIKMELINIFWNAAGDSGMTFPEIVFLILNDDNFDYHIQEIASHTLSLAIMTAENKWNSETDGDIKKNYMDLMQKTYDNFVKYQRFSGLTSNFCLLLTLDDCVDYFFNDFNKDKNIFKRLFSLIMGGDSNINIIYESLFCLWNVSNIKRYFYLFEERESNYIEKIIQVVRTNKIDKIARIGLMIIKNLLESNSCVEILFDLKFTKTINILLTNKWNDTVIKSLLDEIYDFLGKNYKSVK